MTETKSFKFLTNEVSYEEIGTKSNKEFYVKGYISTDEVDRSNEIVTREAMTGMVEQIKNGNVKLDIEHSTFTGENDIPVGKIVDAGMDDKGLWIKATLNKAHSKFSEVWKSIKDGFLDAFSIAYKVKDFVPEIINGIKVTLLKNLELLNVAITGNPVNRTAKMTESFYKSLKYMTEMKGDTMSEEKNEEKIEQPKVEEKKVVEETVEKVDEVVVEEPKPEVKPEPTVAKEEPKVEEPIIEKGPNPLDTIKSLEKEIVELKAQVKAINEEMKKPQLKAIGATDIAEVVEEKIVLKSPLQAI